MAIPGKLAFSPDGKRLTYLHSNEGSLSRVIWALDLATGLKRVLFAPPDEGATDQNVSREEALRRERQRLRETGVTHYAWAESGDTLLVPIRGDVWLKICEQPPKRISTNAIDPALPPDGSRVAF